MVYAKVQLPHTTDEIFLTDGGIETTLIFLEGFELPYFASFHLLKDEKGYAALKKYYKPYLEIAKENKTHFILESATWRASPDWIKKVGYDESTIKEINEKAIGLLQDLKEEYQNDIRHIIISGCVGPRGDGYKPHTQMSANEAQKYHSVQISILSNAGADIISAITMNYVEEAIGVVHAANAVNMPVVISFTMETNGKLPTGMSLEEAIKQVDESSNTPPIYYMINCAHPTHFINELVSGKDKEWTKRIRGIRANASCKSHAELDEATELDRGEPLTLGKEHQELKAILPQLNIFGGCCGTDDEHIAAIVQQVSIYNTVSE